MLLNEQKINQNVEKLDSPIYSPRNNPLNLSRYVLVFNKNHCKDGKFRPQIKINFKMPSNSQMKNKYLTTNPSKMRL